MNASVLGLVKEHTMYVGKMVLSGDIAPAVKAHKRDFPDIPITHVALPRSASEPLISLCAQGFFRVDGTPLEMTTSVVPPPKHIWVGHTQ